MGHGATLWSVTLKFWASRTFWRWLRSFWSCLWTDRHKKSRQSRALCRQNSRAFWHGSVSIGLPTEVPNLCSSVLLRRARSFCVEKKRRRTRYG